jgi:hypothetical protein
MHRHHATRAATVAALFVLAVVASRPAGAQTNLHKELAALSQDVHKLLEGRGETAIAVGQFTGPPHLPSSAGPAISKVLTDELKKAGVEVKLRANLTLEGRYHEAEDLESSQVAVALQVKIVDRVGKEIVGLQIKPRGIFGDATIASLLGLTVNLPANEDTKARDQKLRDSIENPTTNIQGSRIGTDKGPYAVEILVRPRGGKTYEPRKATEREGMAFIDIEREEAYAIRVINDSEHEAAATITIDGLSIFLFSEVRDDQGNPRYSVLVVPARGKLEIRGWHRTNEESDEFLVTEYAKSAAGQLKSTANLGTITVSFAAAWPKDQPPPADEPRDPNEFSRSANATARGTAFKQKYQEVERQFGIVRGSVSVRYSK